MDKIKARSWALLQSLSLFISKVSQVSPFQLVHYWFKQSNQIIYQFVVELTLPNTVLCCRHSARFSFNCFVSRSDGDTFVDKFLSIKVKLAFHRKILHSLLLMRQTSDLHSSEINWLLSWGIRIWICLWNVSFYPCIQGNYFHYCMQEKQIIWEIWVKK